MRLGEIREDLITECIPTGTLALAIALLGVAIGSAGGLSWARRRRRA